MPTASASAFTPAPKPVPTASALLALSALAIAPPPPVFAQPGAKVAGGSPESFGAFIKADIARYASIVKAARIPPQ